MVDEKYENKMLDNSYSRKCDECGCRYECKCDPCDCKPFTSPDGCVRKEPWNK